MAMFLPGTGPRLILLVSAAAAVVLGASAPPHLAHIAGSSRKIRMFMANAYLQLNPNGTISGSPDDTSPTTVLQRSSVSLGQVKIQGVTTCMYLCMDICGIPYSSREFTEECVFNEKIEQHSYNTYSSTKYSNAKRTLYLGMTRRGELRRVQVRTGTVLGRLSTLTRVITQSVPPEEAAKHGRIVCHPLPVRHPRPPRCRLRTRGRPRRRKKKPDDHLEEVPLPRRPLRRKCEPGEDCQRRLLIGRKRKSRLEGAGTGAPRRLRHRKHRTAVRLKEEEEEEERAQEEDEEKMKDDEEDEDVTMTTDDELLTDDHTDLFQDNNDNE